jgi:hypothetical protein
VAVPSRPATVRSAAPFLGEQERIDGLMRAHGAQVFFHGHDHLYSATAKPSATGAGPPVHYVCGGVAAGTGAVWSRLDWVEHGYGTDEEGRADVVRGPGFVRVEVRGPRELVIQYVRSDPWDPRRNGEVLDEIVIPAKIR